MGKKTIILIVIYFLLFFGFAPYYVDNILLPLLDFSIEQFGKGFIENIIWGISFILFFPIGVILIPVVMPLLLLYYLEEK